MTSAQLAIFNQASSAAVYQNRRKLACALRGARRISKPFTQDVLYHASYVGWPLRRRPNGDYR